MVTRLPERDGSIAALRAVRDDILQRWIAAAQALPVHREALAPAEDDPAPDLLDALLLSLDAGANAAEAGRAAAPRYAARRAREGLEAADLLAELGLLRAEIGRALSAQAQNAVPTLLAAHAVLNEQLDALTIAVIRAFEAQRARTPFSAGTFAAIIDAIPDGVYACDLERNPIVANRGGGALLGLPPDAALMTLLTGTPGSIRTADGQPLPQADCPLARALRGDAQANADYLIRHAESGEDRLLRISLAPLRDHAGAVAGGICVAHDVTLLRRLERERDEFVSRTTHELKTPLTSATGLLQLARRRLARQQEDPLGLAPMLETAQKQVDRLATLIDDLRTVSWLRSGRLQFHPSVLDLRQVVDTAARSAQAATTHHALRVQQPSEPLVVRGDAGRLSQVLDALLGNAVKYSPNGGEIGISSRSDDGQAVVDVEDQGIGIPAQDQATLFEPFRRASNANQAAIGMGVGLYIARALARLHGGDVLLLRSHPGGSVFRLMLPLANPESVAGPIDA